MVPSNRLARSCPGAPLPGRGGPLSPTVLLVFVCDEAVEWSQALGDECRSGWLSALSFPKATIISWSLQTPLGGPRVSVGPTFLGSLPTVQPPLARPQGQPEKPTDQ